MHRSPGSPSLQPLLPLALVQRSPSLQPLQPPYLGVLGVEIWRIPQLADSSASLPGHPWCRDPQDPSACIHFHCSCPARAPSAQTAWTAPSVVPDIPPGKPQQGVLQDPQSITSKSPSWHSHQEHAVYKEHNNTQDHSFMFGRSNFSSNS